MPPMSKKTALSALLGAVTLAALVAPVHAEDAKPATEKCYGVAKAAKNDCGNSAHTCKVPAGLCAKLAGGSTTAPAK